MEVAASAITSRGACPSSQSASGKLHGLPHDVATGRDSRFTSAPWKVFPAILGSNSACQHPFTRKQVGKPEG